MNKEFEIYSFGWKQTGVIADACATYPLSIRVDYILQENGLFKSRGMRQEGNIGKLMSEHDIHAVRRLSDGTIFSRGDIIYPNGYEAGHIAEAFMITDNSVSFKPIGRLTYVPINQHSTATSPAGVTRDLFDVFAGDSVWRIENESTSNPTMQEITINDKKDVDGKIIFVRKENAIKFLVENTRCLSISQVQSIIRHSELEKYWEELFTFVKENLNIDKG